VLHFFSYRRAFRCTPEACVPIGYFLLLAGVGFPLGAGEAVGGASGDRPGGNPCCICWGGGWGTEKFSAIVM
jgi:hypothetical protein